jgi:hypothetical protein
MSANGKLPLEEAQQVTSQILEGLHEMHENGFAHRDLKPGVSDYHDLSTIGVTILTCLVSNRIF